MSAWRRRWMSTPALGAGNRLGARAIAARCSSQPARNLFSVRSPIDDYRVGPTTNLTNPKHALN